MSVVVVIQGADQAATMCGWALQFADALGVEARVVVPIERPGASTVDEIELLDGGERGEDETAQTMRDAALAAIRAHLTGDETRDCPALTLHRLRHADPEQGIMALIREWGGRLLVLGQTRRSNPDEPEAMLVRYLFRHAPCDSMVIRPAADSGATCQSILVPTAGGPNASLCLQLASKLVERENGRTDALFVEPKVGEDAALVGQHIVKSSVNKALGRPHPNVWPTVVIANDFRDGIAKRVEENEYDLLLIGASNQWFTRWMLFSALPKALVEQDETGPGLTLAVMRRSLPLTSRLQRGARRLMERAVPQLERADRVALVERVQGNSRWDFDFIALICLSTLIAGLGLIQNSAAVIIGAMLVAPLMTPLVGGGLALVQGNAVLIRHAVKAVTLGFLLAFSIGYVLGWIAPNAALTGQMLSRSEPNVLDLAVAFISGIAAAYATARPNLSAALPGVAIAAALVPPIATSGLALALGRPVVAAGAALLFVTNILAIVLGSAGALFSIGVQANHEHGREKNWTRRMTLGLVSLTIVVAIPLGYWLYDSIPAEDVQPEYVELVRSRVALLDGAELLSVTKAVSRDEIELTVTISAPVPPDEAMASQIADLMDDHYGRPCRVRLRTQLVSEALSGSR